MEWRTTAYGHHNRGQGLWGTPYVATPGGAPLSVRSTEYYLKRFGVLTSLSWKGNSHEVEGGVWYEDTVRPPEAAVKAAQHGFSHE